MKKIFLLLICLLSSFVFSHTINYDTIVLRHWSIQKEHKFIDGSFSMIKNGTVYIEDAQNKTFKYPLSSLSLADQKYVNERQQRVNAINKQTILKDSTENIIMFYAKFLIIALILLALICEYC